MSRDTGDRSPFHGEVIRKTTGAPVRLIVLEIA
jgi:hypothetical protein